MNIKITRPLSNNILVVEDLMLLLPDNFKGTINDALQYLVEYMKESEKVETPYDDKSSVEILFTEEELNGRLSKLSMKYGLFTKNKDGSLDLVEKID